MKFFSGRILRHYLSLCASNITDFRVHTPRRVCRFDLSGNFTIRRVFQSERVNFSGTKLSRVELLGIQCPVFQRILDGFIGESRMLEKDGGGKRIVRGFDSPPSSDVAIAEPHLVPSLNTRRVPKLFGRRYLH